MKWIRAHLNTVPPRPILLNTDLIVWVGVQLQSGSPGQISLGTGDSPGGDLNLNDIDARNKILNIVENSPDVWFKALDYGAAGGTYIRLDAICCVDFGIPNESSATLRWNSIHPFTGYVVSQPEVIQRLRTLVR